MTMFKPATREKLKLRMAIDGPSGSGKTFTALRAAFTLGQRVAVADSEHRSAAKYVGLSPDGFPWQFDVCELSHFAPTTYAQVIKEAEAAGYDVLIIDSLSHAWDGVGGALDQVDRKAGSGGNSYTAWKDVTPQHRDMIEAILGCKMHVISTMRTKMGYVLEPDAKGKMVPKKVGMETVQRQGMEYEFDVVVDMDVEHLAKVTKSRCPEIDGLCSMKPGPEFFSPLVRWLNTGAEPIQRPLFVPQVQQPQGPMGVVDAGVYQATGTDNHQSGDTHRIKTNGPCLESQVTSIIALAQKLFVPPEAIEAAVQKRGKGRLAELTYAEAQEILANLERMAAETTPPF